MEGSPPPDTRVYEMEGWKEEETISILVATDNHLGCYEKDPVRGEDSFTTFEEILKLAVEKQVDMVLLGGDLFHENKPSRHTLHRTMTLLRQYCWGDKPCQLEFLSDQTLNFKDSFGTVNYQDPNINVSLPVFSIHGNHDEPCGKGGLCSLDLLSTAGLVNYFGKTPSVDDITVHPILLQKGSTRLALYGLGNVRDERLHETFNKGGVQIIQPSEDSDSWFNLLTIHQNRVAHTRTSYIPENYLSAIFDLVIWGHEHECLIDPQLNLERGFYVSQPGSSIATSLIEGESVPKHVAIIKINSTSFHLEKIPLKTVRPFNYRTIQYDAQPRDDSNDFNKISKYILGEIDEMIKLAIEDYQELCPDVPVARIPKPLIRLRVELGPNMEVVSPVRFLQPLINKVANPRDAVFFSRQKNARGDKNKNRLLSQMAAHAFSQPNSGLNTLRIENLFLEAISDFKPNLIPARPMFDAIQKYVFKGEKDSITDLLDAKTKEALKYLKVHCDSDHPDAIREEVRQFTERKLINTITQVESIPEDSPSQPASPKDSTMAFSEDEWDSPPNKRRPSPKKPAASKPAEHSTFRSTRSTTNPTRNSKSKSNDIHAVDSDDHSDEPFSPPPPASTLKRGRPTTTTDEVESTTRPSRSNRPTRNSTQVPSSGSVADTWNHSVVDSKTFSQIFDSEDENDEFYVPPTPTLGATQELTQEMVAPAKVAASGSSSRTTRAAQREAQRTGLGYQAVANSGGQTQLSFQLPRTTRSGAALTQQNDQSLQNTLSQVSLAATEIISDDEED